MASAGAQAGLDTFDALHIEYENAYKDNPFKKRCIEKAISLLPPNSRVLDVGCGTGFPVSDMLSRAGHSVFGIDISPNMIHHAQSRVAGTFKVSDMLAHRPEGPFRGVFIIFSQLQLSYADFHSAAFKFAQALEPGGILALGQMPSDSYVDRAALDETGTYVEDYPSAFMGEPCPTFMISREGQLNFLRSMGLEIVDETFDNFQPDNPKCDSEDQQYIVARRPSEEPLRTPLPLPLHGK